MNKRKKFFVCLLALTLILSSSITPISAATYNLLPYNYASGQIKYYYDNYNSSRFKTFLNNAASVWNTSGIAHASLTYQYGTGVYCTEGNYPNAQEDGWTIFTWNSSGIITSAYMTINTGTLVTWNNDSALKSVFVHEFGHVLSCDDNYPLQCVMNKYTWGSESRYGSFGITSPQPIDVQGVNYVY